MASMIDQVRNKLSIQERHLAALQGLHDAFVAALADMDDASPHYKTQLREAARIVGDTRATFRKLTAESAASLAHMEQNK